MCDDDELVKLESFMDCYGFKQKTFKDPYDSTNEFSITK